MKNVKKIAASVVIIVGFALYAWYARSENTTSKQTAAQTTSAEPTSSNAATAATGDSVTTTAATSAFKDGAYTGSAADAFYGNIQVKATISGGKLTNVEFLQYPNDQPNSTEINESAMPILKQEAIQNQSAQVDNISGATDTTKAYIESLESALNQAKV